MDERLEFARVIVQEYAHLLDRRFREQAARDDDHALEFAAHDWHYLREIQDRVLPEIEAGRFEIEIHPGGLIKVGTSHGSVNLRAPNDSWDAEMQDRVTERMQGNQFAEAALARSKQNEANWARGMVAQKGSAGEHEP